MKLVYEPLKYDYLCTRMMTRILLYLKYYFFSSTNLHGIHSPFVFNLVKYCIRDKKKFPEYRLIKGYRNSLLNDKRALLINDLGAKKSTRPRRVASIAGTASSDLKKAGLLFRLSRYFKPPVILELGTNLGVGSCSLALGSPEARIYTIEGDHGLHSIASELNQKYEGIKFLEGSFDEVLPELLKSIHPSLVYIDGNHRLEPTLRYFELLSEHADENTILVFDDIYWSAEMRKAWEHIKSSPKVTVSIDLFRVGIISFRKGQVKEHFVVRF